MHDLPPNPLAVMRRRFWPSRNLLTRWRQAASGSTALEFALMAGLLVVLAVGAYDFGRLGIEKSRMTSAAQAGSRYGARDQGTADDVAGMVRAARDDAGDVDGSLSIAAGKSCRCPDAGEVSCSTTCSDGAYPPMYVEVTVQGTLALLFDYPGIAPSFTLGSTSAMRVR